VKWIRQLLGIDAELEPRVGRSASRSASCSATCRARSRSMACARIGRVSCSSRNEDSATAPSARAPARPARSRAGWKARRTRPTPSAARPPSPAPLRIAACHGRPLPPPPRPRFPPSRRLRCWLRVRATGSTAASCASSAFGSGSAVDIPATPRTTVVAVSPTAAGYGVDGRRPFTPSRPLVPRRPHLRPAVLRPVRPMTPRSGRAGRSSPHTRCGGPSRPGVPVHRPWLQSYRCRWWCRGRAAPHKDPGGARAR
jgi:hypothetical protein